MTHWQPVQFCGHCHARVYSDHWNAPCPYCGIRTELQTARPGGTMSQTETPAPQPQPTPPLPPPDPNPEPLPGQTEIDPQQDDDDDQAG